MFITAKGLIFSSRGTYGFMNMSPLLRNQLWLSKFDSLPTLILIHIYGLVVSCSFNLFPIYMLWQDKDFLPRANIADEIELQG